MNEVGAGVVTVSSLVSSIISSSNRVRVNKIQCQELARECKWLRDRLKSGNLSAADGPTVEAIKDLLVQCDKDMKKFAGIGFLMRTIRSGGVSEICVLRMEALERWRVRIEGPSPSPCNLAAIDGDDDSMGGMDGLNEEDDIDASIQFVCDVDQNQDDAINALSHKPVFHSELVQRAIVAPESLIIGREIVGRFPFGDVYVGTYKGQAVYIREISRDTPPAVVKTIKAGIMLAQCLSDCQAIVPIHGFCGERQIVTDKPAKGPLNEYRGILTTKQKVAMARKVADGLVFMHDIATSGGRKRVVHRDIRAANVMLSEDLEPMLTGFEMCKGDGHVTGYFPDTDESYKKWWPPERLSGFGSSPASDVYSFGVLMYEISTGNEPEPGVNLVEHENNRLCAEYTALIGRCMQTHYNARPKMDEVMEELLTIESQLA
ncbi:hypothetical protein KVV02_005566 [Mortierella alpina]|uniref:Protein kinase domain-containing protein n=1 Tax=Mortierella alpina TaxID=64518 RepID=A0A9P8CTX8_MORAP|nr:hypothetical protein KVV02_005566 [Mortierella alpina]